MSLRVAQPPLGADSLPKLCLKGEEPECVQASALRLRLAPSIRTAVAAAVDALLAEAAALLDEALRESRRENARLRTRLEASEGELRALREGQGPPGLTQHLEDLKAGEVCVHTDGMVSNNLLESISHPDLWAQAACAAAGKGVADQRGCRPVLDLLETPLGFVIKQEQDSGPPMTRPDVPAENEQTAHSVGDLGRIHVVMEEDRLHGAPCSEERPYPCAQCGKCFRLLSSLKKHTRIHTGEKPYPCEVCGRRFRESGALKTHRRIHTGEKPYRCADCGTSFRHLDGLRKHRRTHTGEKPYVCALCGKRLSRLQHLKHHQRIHTGERPCRCTHCSKSFAQPAALRRHMRTHTEGEPEPPALSNMSFGMWVDDGDDVAPQQ